MEDYPGDTELINSLHTIADSIRSNQITSNQKKKVYTFLQELLTDREDGLDPDMAKYLFRGWWMTNIFENMGVEQEQGDCPLCLSKKSKSQ